MHFSKQEYDNDDEDWDPNNINSLKLIEVIKPHDVLYNSDHEKYHDKAFKDSEWEKIYIGMFPRYPVYNGELQGQISFQVRRRWKTLRNAIAREVKLIATNEKNYSRRKESALISELEFLIPYIKSPFCEKLTEELGLSRMVNENTCDTDKTSKETKNVNDHANLTDENPITEALIKKELIMDADCSDSDETPDIEKDRVDNDHIVTTTTQTKAPETSTDCNKDGHTVVNYNESELLKSIKMSPKHSTENNIKIEKNPVPVTRKRPYIEESNSGTENNTKIKENSELIRKRPRIEGETDNDTSTNLQSKIFELLLNMERRQLQLEKQPQCDPNDMDRMFLISLVSELKLLPPSKKMAVKAEIATAIAKAMPLDA